VNDPDETLKALDAWAAARLRPGLPARVLALRRSARAQPSWGLPAIVAAFVCGAAGLLFWVSERSEAAASDSIAQWGELVQTARELSP